MKKILVVVAMASLALSACKKEDAPETTDNAEAVIEAASKTVEPAEVAEAPETPEAEPVPAAPSAATVALLKLVDEGTELTVAQVQDSFKVDGAAWMGKKVKVKALYLNTNTMKSGDEVNHNIVLVDEKGEIKTRIGCAVTEKPDGLMQYTPIVAEGTVDKMFGAYLRDCSFTK